MIDKIRFELNHVMAMQIEGENVSLMRLKIECLHFNEKVCEVFDLSLPDELFLKSVIALLNEVCM